MWREGDWARHTGCSKVGVPNFRFQMFKSQNVSRSKTVFWDVPQLSLAMHSIARLKLRTFLLVMIAVPIHHFSTKHIYLYFPLTNFLSSRHRDRVRITSLSGHHSGHTAVRVALNQLTLTQCFTIQLF